MNAVMCVAGLFARSTPQQTYSSPASSGISQSEAGARVRFGTQDTPRLVGVVDVLQSANPRGAAAAAQSLNVLRSGSESRAFGGGGIGLSSLAILSATSS